MKTLGNIIWHVPFLGFITALITFLWGGFLIITVIGAPIGLGLIQLSLFLLSPFSKTMIDKGEIDKHQNPIWKTYGYIVRIFYFPFGLILAILTIIQIICLFVTIIGIPIAIILAKSLSTYFNPVNKKCVPSSVANELEQRKAKEYVDNKLK